MPADKINVIIGDRLDMENSESIIGYCMFCGKRVCCEPDNKGLKLKDRKFSCIDCAWTQLPLSPDQRAELFDR